MRKKIDREHTHTHTHTHAHPFSPFHIPSLIHDDLPSMDNDDFRRDWLIAAAAATGRPGFRVAPDVSVPARRDAQLDVMADLLTAHLDLDAVLELLGGPRPARPTITSALGR